MREFKEYIFEKLHINKDTKISTDESDYIFMIVWSDKGTDKIDTFNTREDAQNFISNLKNPQVYLDGYAVPDTRDILWELMSLVRKGDFDKVKDFCKKHKIKRFYE